MKKLKLLAVLAVLCLSSVVPTYAQNIPQEVAVNEPIAVFENGVLYIENLDTSYVGEEIFVVNKEKANL